MMEDIVESQIHASIKSCSIRLIRIVYYEVKSVQGENCSILKSLSSFKIRPQQKNDRFDYS